ncbi:MAG: hypothetical protein ACM3SY_16875 [Candidatus Omnitrophota bacterium]
MTTMKPFRHPVILCLLVLLALTAGLTAETQVSISASDNNVEIGDKINLKILVKTNTDVQEIKIKFPEKPFDILQQQHTVKNRQNDYTVLEKNISLAFFKVGEFNIGPLTIQLTKNGKAIETKTTNSIPITVKSALKPEDKDIQPLKDLIAVNGNPLAFFLKYVLIPLAGLLALIALIWWFKKRKKKSEASSQPLLSPLDELEHAITELWDQKLFDQGKTKFHFLSMTEVLKRFLYRNYGFNAEDLTTSETLDYLKKVEQENVILNDMRYALDIADLAKFAKFIPDPTVMSKVLHHIHSSIDVYKQRIRQAELETAQNPKSEATPQ